MAVLTAEVLMQQAVLLARGGPEAESAARLLLRASLSGSEARAAALRSGVLSAILPYLRPSTPSDVLLLLTQTYSNFCRHGESEPPVELGLVAPALPLIKDLLDCEDQHVLEATCTAFKNITHGGGGHARAVQEVDGLSTRLETLLTHPASSVKLAALLALGNILAAGNTQDIQSQALQLQTAVIFYTQDEDVIYERGTVFTIADIAEERYKRRNRHGCVMIQFLDKAIIERLIAALGSDDCPDLQREAADALNIFYNLTLEDDCHHETAVPKLVTLAVKGGEAAIPAINALIFIALPDGVRKQAVQDSGVVTTLLPHLRLDARHELLEAILDLYRELSQGMKKEQVEMFAPALPLILDLLTVEHLDIRRYSLLTLNHIMLFHEGKEAVLAVPGLLTRVVELLSSEELRRYAMDVVAQLLKGNQLQKEQCLDAGCLDHMERIFKLLAKKSKLSYDERDLKWGACRAVSAIFKGTPELIQRALDKGLLDYILKLLKLSTNWHFAEEAALEALNNFCASGSADQCGQFVASGGLQMWAAVLRGDYDKLAKTALTGLQALLKTTKKHLDEDKKVNENENEDEEEEEEEDEDEDEEEDEDEDEKEDEDGDEEEVDVEDEEEEEDEEEVNEDEIEEEEKDESKTAGKDKRVNALRSQLEKEDFSTLLREARTRFDISWTTYNSLIDSAAAIGIDLK